MYVTQALGIQHPDNVIDFSVNTNPYGPPSCLKSALKSGALIEMLTSYPDPEVTQLKSELADSFGINSSMLLIGNGAAELIFLIANVFQNKRVAIIEPAFSEYRDACIAYGCEVTSIILSPPWILTYEEVEPYLQGTDLLFLCTPNNPTGVTYDEKEIVKIIKKADTTGTSVVIDEAFFDFTMSQKTFSNLISEYSNLVILRSLTKMYAIAGLRLGYVIGPPILMKKMKERQPPWSVNGLAQQVGLQLLQEKAYVKETVAKVSSERERVKREAEQLGFSVSDSSVNFYLLSEPSLQNMDHVMKFLIKKGIIVRHTYNFNGLEGNYLRCAVKTKEENDLLLASLKEWRGTC